MKLGCDARGYSRGYAPFFSSISSPKKYTEINVRLRRHSRLRSMAMLHFSHPFLRPRNIQQEMPGFVGILVSDPWLQNQFTQVELRSLKSHVIDWCSVWFPNVYLTLQGHASARTGSNAKNSSAFLKAATTTLLHTISESEKASYVAHINNYLAQDDFLNR